MAYVVATSGCCHCKTCWDLADVPHETRGVVFTVREMHDDGFEYHVIQDGFRTRAAAVAAFEESKIQRVVLASGAAADEGPAS
jgi:hypothetical protein